MHTRYFLQGLETLQYTLNRHRLLSKYDKYQFGTHAAKGMYARSKRNNSMICFCKIVRLGGYKRGSTSALTLEIQILEQHAILVIPSLTHIHTIRSIEFCECRRTSRQKILILDFCQRLSLLVFCFRSQFVETLSLSLCYNNFGTLGFGVQIQGDGPISICDSIPISVGSAINMERDRGRGTTINALCFAGDGIGGIVGTPEILDLPQVLLDERHVGISSIGGCEGEKVALGSRADINGLARWSEICRMHLAE